MLLCMNKCPVDTLANSSKLSIFTMFNVLKKWCQITGLTMWSVQDPQNMGIELSKMKMWKWNVKWATFTIVNMNVMNNMSDNWAEKVKCAGTTYTKRIEMSIMKNVNSSIPLQWIICSDEIESWLQQSQSVWQMCWLY